MFGLCNACQQPLCLARPLLEPLLVHCFQKVARWAKTKKGQGSSAAPVPVGSRCESCQVVLSRAFPGLEWEQYVIKTKTDPSFKAMVESCIMVYERKRPANFVPEGFTSNERVGILTEFSLLFVSEDEFARIHNKKMQSVPELVPLIEEWHDENNEKQVGIFIKDPERPHRRVTLQRWCGTNWHADIEQPCLQLRAGQARATQEMYCKDELRCRPKALRTGGVGTALSLQQLESLVERQVEVKVEQLEQPAPAVNVNAAAEEEEAEVEEAFARPNLVLPSEAQAKAKAKAKSSKRKAPFQAPEPAARVRRASNVTPLTAASLASLPSGGAPPVPFFDQKSAADTVGGHSRRSGAGKEFEKLCQSAENYVTVLALPKVLEGWACGREKHAAERLVRALNEREEGCAEGLALQSHIDLVEAAMAVNADVLASCSAEQKKTSFSMLRPKVAPGSEPPKWRFAVLAAHLKEQRASSQLNVEQWLDSINPLGDAVEDEGLPIVGGTGWILLEAQYFRNLPPRVYVDSR